MKTNFFKRTFPFAAVAVLGVSGAFFTTSMQSAKAVALVPGYISTAAPCDTYRKECNDEVNGPLCTIDGQQLYDKFDCTRALRDERN